MVFGSSVKNDHIVIISNSAVFKFKLTKREEIEKALGKIAISREKNSVSERHKVWKHENLKTKYDRENGEQVPTECVLVYRTSNVNCTIGDIAKKFKEMIR